jgi:HD domain
MNVKSTVGTVEWTECTGGRLEPAERRRLVGDLALVHVSNVVGRFSVLAHLDSGRHSYVSPARVLPPDSPLTRAAEDVAIRVLPATLLNHSYRAYRFASALGELEGLEVDTEVLFAAALLHDTGLVLADGRDDFTLTSARLARDVAEQAGLSTPATQTLQTAITMHYTPKVTLAAGPVAYLLAAGAGVDVVGMRCWDLPPSILAEAVHDYPREGFKAYFTRAWAAEAARVPQGRAKLLRRYGAFSAAIALAPFDE